MFALWPFAVSCPRVLPTGPRDGLASVRAGGVALDTTNILPFFENI